MTAYKCKDPGCVESVAWHLMHGELDCIGDNREAVAEYATAAEARVNPHVVLFVSAAGFADQQVSIDLIPVDDIPHHEPEPGESVEPEPEMEMTHAHSE